MTEAWRDVPGYEGLYQVSDCGRVRSFHRGGRVLRVCPNSTGRLGLVLCLNGSQRSFQVHRLVMAAFVGPCPDGMEVCHNDGNHLNNRLENLRYGTRSDNQYDRVKHGTHTSLLRTHCPSGHPYAGENLAFSPNGLDAGGNPKTKRRCRECSRLSQRTTKKKELV
jgi:hypothetical protein